MPFHMAEDMLRLAQLPHSQRGQAYGFAVSQDFLTGELPFQIGELVQTGQKPLLGTFFNCHSLSVLKYEDRLFFDPAFLGLFLHWQSVLNPQRSCLA